MALTSPLHDKKPEPKAEVKAEPKVYANVVAVEPWEPYPTGAPPDFSSVPLRVHTPQENTEAVHWQAQSEENLAAGGMIAGALPYEPPAPPEPEPEPEDDDLRDAKRKAGGKSHHGRDEKHQEHASPKSKR